MGPIAIACYISVGSWVGYVAGVEVKEMPLDRLLFQPNAKQLKGVPKVIETMVVHENDCKYLEDPVLARRRNEDNALRLQAAQKIAPPEPEVPTAPADAQGEQEWCLVNGYEQRFCYYGTMSACLKAMQKFKHKLYAYCTHRDYAPYTPKKPTQPKEVNK